MIRAADDVELLSDVEEFSVEVNTPPNGAHLAAISPSGIFSDGEMAALERQHRDAVAQFRARFSERPES